MDIQAYETQLLTQLKKITEKIIESNQKLNIQVQKGERQGDLISKTLENEFIKNVITNEYFKDSTKAILGKTKSPYDIQTYFDYEGIKEKIWIDFKAFNLDNQDSNADGGSFKKVIELIQQGGFYIIYVYCYYKGKDSVLQFEKLDSNNGFTKVFFLKDISSKMHIPPTNQMQVDYKLPTEYRSRVEFLDFFFEKVKESYERRSIDSKDMLEKLNKYEIRLGNYKKPKPPKEYKRPPKVVKVPKVDTITFDELKRLNSEQEDKIKNL